MIIALISVVVIIYGLFLYVSKRDESDIRKNFSRSRLIEYEKEILDYKRKYNLRDDMTVDDVLRALDSTIETKAIGFLKEAETQNRRITLNTRLNEKSKTFVLWHEIAHILQGETSPVARTVHFSLRRRPIKEQVCDYYAAALILPQESLLNRLKNEAYMEKSRTEKELFINNLADEKNVYKEVIERRIEEVICINNL